MTVQELIDQLNNIEHKTRDVQDKEGYPVDRIEQGPYTHSISLYYED